MASNRKAPEKIDPSLSFQILKWEGILKETRRQRTKAGHLGWEKQSGHNQEGRVKVESVKLYPVPFCPAGPISPPTLQTCRSPKLVLMLLDRLSAQSRGKKSGSAGTERGGGQQWWQASSDNPKLGPARPIFAPFSPPGRSKLGPFTCQVRTKGIKRWEDKRLTDSDKGIRGRKSFDSECTLQVNETIQGWIK